MGFLEGLLGRPKEQPIPKLLLTPDSLKAKFKRAAQVEVSEAKEPGEKPTYRLAARQIELTRTPIHHQPEDKLFAYLHLTPSAGEEKIIFLSVSQPPTEILPEQTFCLNLPKEAYWQEGKAVLYVEAEPHQWVVSGISVPKSIFIRSRLE